MSRFTRKGSNQAVNVMRTSTGSMPLPIRGQIDLKPPEKPVSPPRDPVLRPARVALMLVQAQKFLHMLDQGQAQDFHELASKSGLTRARVTQLINLTLLAPDIRQEILQLQSVDGIEPMTERRLRKLIGVECWEEQRRNWKKIRTLHAARVARTTGCESG